MENDYSSFIEKNEDGSIKSFDETKMTSYIDSLVSKGVESYKAKTAKEAEIAKMTADEQLNARIKEFEKQQAEWEVTVKSQKRDIVVEKAKAKLGDNFSEDEKKLLLQNVTDDEKTSMKYIETLVAERLKFIEEKTKSIIDELQSKQPTSNSQSNSKDEGSQTTPVKKNLQDIKNFYK